MPSRVTDAGAKPHVVLTGNVPQLNVTVCVEPFVGVTVNITVADCPAVIVWEAGVAPTEKSGTGMDCVRTTDMLMAKFTSPAYCAVMEWLPDASAEVANVAVA